MKEKLSVHWIEYYEKKEYTTLSIYGRQFFKDPNAFPALK